MKPTLLLPLMLFSCREVPKDEPPLDTDTSVPAGADADGDGFASGVDCDDSDAAIYPGAAEACDGLDNNCSGEVDEGLLSTWFADADADGFGDELSPTEACVSPTGHVENGGDCNDLDAAVHPDAQEVCDGADNNCDGFTDDADSVDAETWYRDVDLDGWGVETMSEVACTAPAGFVLGSGDCDDADPAYHPGALEADCADPNDYNCDGSVGYADADGDGFAACEDCDDDNADANDDAPETCDGVDNDCDGLTDSDDPDTVGTSVFYGDSDGDGYGGTQYEIEACEAAPGYVATDDDCDDLDAASHPGASEVCDGADNDCDSDVDEGVGLTWYQDSDADGYGNGSVSSTSCDAPSGYVGNALDCDDFNAATNPGSYEICDGADNDCDGSTDEDAINASVFYVDGDLDGYGSAASSTSACDAPSGYADNDSDCNDADASVSPSATETCDGADNDCDGNTDESDATDASTWYQDLDGDGFGNSSSQTTACSQPNGYVSDATDCDDSTSSVHPGQSETWYDGIDSDCDTMSDYDADSDGEDFIDYGGLDCDDQNPSTQSCGGTAASALEDCQALLSHDPTLTSGVYFINPQDNGAFQVYCDMDLYGGGWTLAAKFTNQDARYWAASASAWTDTTAFGTTTDLSTDADAKGEAWSRVLADDFLLTDDLNPLDHVATNNTCIGGQHTSDFFATMLQSFPHGYDTYSAVCDIDFSYQPNWTTEPDWDNQTATSGSFSFADNQVVIGRTDSGGDTSGVISFYRLSKQEADVGLGSLEDGQSFTITGRSQDIGGPTSCSYDDTECATEYPETVFFYVR